MFKDQSKLGLETSFVPRNKVIEKFNHSKEKLIEEPFWRKL